MTLSSLAYAGIPYHSRGTSDGALALTMACTRLAMARSGAAIAAIFASTTLSPSVLPPFSSWTYSFIAARSSAVNPVRFFGLIEVLPRVSERLHTPRDLERCHRSAKQIEQRCAVRADQH